MSDDLPEQLDERLREMRRRLRLIASGRPYFDAESWSSRPHGAQVLIRTAFIVGEREGLSGEDTMTLMAYELAAQCDRHFEKLLKDARLSAAPLIVKEPS